MKAAPSLFPPCPLTPPRKGVRKVIGDSSDEANGADPGVFWRIYSLWNGFL